MVVENLGVLEQLACFLERPVFGNLVLFLVQLVHNILNAPVLLDERDGAGRTDAFYRVAIVAAEQNAQVDKLEGRSDKSKLSAPIDWHQLTLSIVMESPSNTESR